VRSRYVGIHILTAPSPVESIFSKKASTLGGRSPELTVMIPDVRLRIQRIAIQHAPYCAEIM
jgi:hypothetical protein